jgi:tetratricopeptide (TPR) repeat protein
MHRVYDGFRSEGTEVDHRLLLRACHVAALPAIAVLACLTTGHAAQSLSVTDLLDRYLNGQFDAVVTHLETLDDFRPVLQGLRDEGAAWIEAGGTAARERRELTAATFALEAARVDEWNEWKDRRLAPSYLDQECGPDGKTPKTPEILVWKPAPLLIVWGSSVFTRDSKPRAAERWWQLAAVAVAQRAEDFEFMRSDGVFCLYNPEDEIDYLHHLRQRFPDEPRFKLAEAMLSELNRRAAKGTYTFEQLQDDPDVGGEATMRLGVRRFQMKDDDGAISTLDRVESRTRDPWVLYLARYFKGQAFERRKRTAEAERAYRGALAAVPFAQSASMALAALLFKNDRRTEASRLMDAMFAASPRPADPWRGYADADDRFWPVLIGRLRAEIRR